MAIDEVLDKIEKVESIQVSEILGQAVGAVITLNIEYKAKKADAGTENVIYFGLPRQAKGIYDALQELYQRRLIDDSKFFSAMIDFLGLNNSSSSNGAN